MNIKVPASAVDIFKSEVDLVTFVDAESCRPPEIVKVELICG